MTTKSTKRALIVSVLSLFICFTMLLGTTYAWFTDSVTSAGNIIKTGTLEVEMHWAKATEDPSSANWQDASAGAIFKHQNWEPGYVEARHIKISNVGSLALKYKLAISPNGEVSELADVIDVYFVDPAVKVETRDSLAALTPVGTLREMIEDPDGAAYGSLLKDEVKTVTIALKMRENAGNEYQNLSIGTSFSVVLMATQDNVEADDLDENYDDIEIPEMHIENIDGVTYGSTIDGDRVMISVDDYTLTTFTVDDKVTVLGTGDGVNDNDRVFGKNAPLTSLTLPEGLTEIKDNALNALPNLTTVNIPSTVKTIGIQSFRTTGMSEVTLPENVETVKLGAFRDMANLTTVTVEGNVAFDNYAFRSCPNLTSIYLLGDDVTFAGGQFATHSDNGDATGITIYVKNATVAARVYAAQTSAYGYEVKILGDAVDGSDAQEVVKATNNTQLDDAIQAGTTTVVLGSGNYIIPDSAQGKTLTIVGNGDTVVATQDDGSYEGCDYSLDGATVTFEGITINTDSTTCTGYARCKGTYNNCTINGTFTLYDNSTFNNCEFNVTGDVYNIWTWGASEATFNNCTFNSDGKAILLYGGSNTKLTLNGCTFNENGGLTDLKAAVEIGDDYGTSFELIVNDTEVNGYEINNKGINTGTTLWGNKNSMPKERLNVVVDGVDVY
ncbi:MAG: leucine-rich repeat domain-containing protein [Ruminococcaceae bacterium]|nr:leucine-rich repeat domain-containing protein [Oscillospiraceae bacterium]